MALWDILMRAVRGAKLPCEEDMASLRRYYSSADSKPRLNKAEKWARRLYAAGNFEELASGMDSDYHKGEDKYEYWNIYKDVAARVLKASGAKAVPGILAAFEKRPREDEIAAVLASINDPRGVPAIKRFLDRGGASASTLKYTLKEFLARHAEIAAQVDTAKTTCCLCGKLRPITEMREYVGAGYFFRQGLFHGFEQRSKACH